MDTFVSNDDGERINPATEDKQDDIVTAIDDSLVTKSTSGGTQKLTISSNVAQGTSQACRSILVVHASDNAVYMNIGATADADDFIIPKNVIVPVPVDNCSDLYFYGTDADTIRLLWRN